MLILCGALLYWQYRDKCAQQKQSQTVPFPIDVVYTWVDTNDAKWQDERNFWGKHVKGENSSDRFPETHDTSEEIRLSIQSILAFAPWVRKIFIVTSLNQRPNLGPGLDSRVLCVSHEQLFPDLTHLPTFNSHAIESHLHQVPGLAEQFMYFNDDTYLGNVVYPTDFFTPQGQPIFRTSKLHSKLLNLRRSLPLPDPPNLIAHVSAWHNLCAKFPTEIFMPIHQMVPLNQHICHQAHKLYPEWLETTSLNKFRYKTDLPPIGLFLNVGLTTGECTLQTPRKIKSFYLSGKLKPKKEDYLVFKKQAPELVCINYGDAGDGWNVFRQYVQQSLNYIIVEHTPSKVHERSRKNLWNIK